MPQLTTLDRLIKLAEKDISKFEGQIEQISIRKQIAEKHLSELKAQREQHGRTKGQ